MLPLGPLVVVESAVEGRKKTISWKDTEDFGQLTCGTNISAITRDVDGTRLVLGWRIVRRRRRRGLLLVARRCRRLLVVRRRLLDVGRSGVIVCRRRRVGDLWGSG